MTTWWFPLDPVLALASRATASTAANLATGDGPGVDEPALILTGEGANLTSNALPALSGLLSGIQDADEGGVVDADVVGRERPAGGVPAGRWLVRCRRSWARCRWLVDDFADGGAGGGFVDEVLAGGERGDEGL